MAVARIEVEVVYALPQGVDAVRVVLAAGATLRDALAAAGTLTRHPEVDVERWKVGIHGRLAERDSVLADGDRVEIYRPLLLDPKEARRRRARLRR